MDLTRFQFLSHYQAVVDLRANFFIDDELDYRLCQELCIKASLRKVILSPTSLEWNELNEWDGELDYSFSIKQILQNSSLLGTVLKCKYRGMYDSEVRMAMDVLGEISPVHVWIIDE